MTKNEIEEKSRRIVENLKKTQQFKAGKVILLYMSINNEVATKDLIKECICEGKIICLPLTKKAQKRLEIYKICDLEKDLYKGIYGIYEPIPNENSIVNPTELDIAIIPGIAFDIRKNRLGYGGGYFDRLLPELNPKAIKIGLAFDWQVFHEIPTEKFDGKMNSIITEDRIIL